MLYLHYGSVESSLTNLTWNVTQISKYANVEGGMLPRSLVVLHMQSSAHADAHSLRKVRAPFANQVTVLQTKVSKN